MMAVENAVIRTTILSSCSPQTMNTKERGINIWFLYSGICIAHPSRSCTENSDSGVMEKMHYATGLESIMNSGPWRPTENSRLPNSQLWGFMENLHTVYFLPKICSIDSLNQLICLQYIVVSSHTSVLAV